MEGVRVDPRLLPVLELVAREPEAVAGLQVVARRGLAVPRRAGRQERRERVDDRRLRRDQRRDRVDDAGERYNARAAASSSSNSGTSSLA